MKRGNRFVAYGDWPARSRLYIEVRRVARDMSWADIRVCTWAVAWAKRMPLDGGELPEAARAQPYAWTQRDLDAQQRDWAQARAKEEG